VAQVPLNIVLQAIEGQTDETRWCRRRTDGREISVGKPGSRIGIRCAKGRDLPGRAFLRDGRWGIL